MISIKKRSRKSILNDVEVPEPGESSKKRCLKKPTTSTAPAADTKEALFDELDHWILKKGLTELHTHLLGMGSADFWVTRIIESYLPRAANALGNDVEYPLETILEASGFSKACDPIDLSVFEAMFFDSSESETLCSAFREVQINDNERKVCISNNKLVELLHAEDKVASLRGGSLRALVRNWFEFLGSNGNSAHHSEILKSCKSTFFP